MIFDKTFLNNVLTCICPNPKHCGRLGHISGPICRPLCLRNCPPPSSRGNEDNFHCCVDFPLLSVSDTGVKRSSTYVGSTLVRKFKFRTGKLDNPSGRETLFGMARVITLVTPGRRRLKGGRERMVLRGDGSGTQLKKAHISLRSHSILLVDR